MTQEQLIIALSTNVSKKWRLSHCESLRVVTSKGPTGSEGNFLFRLAVKPVLAWEREARYNKDSDRNSFWLGSLPRLFAEYPHDIHGVLP